MTANVDLTPARMLRGEHVFRVVSKLNTDILVGYCWCGEPHESEDPIALWTWLLEHPDGHPSGQGGGPPTAEHPHVLEPV